jgi:hypothetical protein
VRPLFSAPHSALRATPGSSQVKPEGRLFRASRRRRISPDRIREISKLPRSVHLSLSICMLECLANELLSGLRRGANDDRPGLSWGRNGL